MSNIKISEMAEAESLNDDDLLTIVQSGVNKKIKKKNAIGDIIQAINNPTYTTTEGTDLSIDNTRVGKMKFKFYGDTEQDSYNGENLFDKDNPNILNNCVTGSGLTLDALEGCKTLYVPCKPNLTYTITKIASTRFIVVTTTNTPAIGVATSARSIDLTGTSITITTSATANYICVFYYYSGSDTLTEQEILNSIYIKIDTPLPNPDYPIEVQTVTGENTIDVVGKNLFDKSKAQLTVGYLNGNGEFVAGGTSSATQEYIQIMPNTDMTLSGSDFTVYAFYDKNKNFIERIVQASSSFTFNKNAYYIRFQGYTSDINLDTIQLNIGTSSGTYEPYKSQSYELNLGKNLTTRLTKQISYNLNGLYAWWEGNTIGVAGTNTKTDANWTVLSDYVPIMPNFRAGEIYTLSAPDMPTDTILAINYIPIGSSGQASLCLCDGASKKITFTVPSNYGSVGQIFFVIKSTATTIKVKFNYMLEKGSQATDFVPYLTPVELCQIDNYQDYIYNNGGKWFKHKVVEKIKLNGSHTGIRTTTDTNAIYRFCVDIGTNIVTEDASTIAPFFCDKLKSTNRNQSYAKTVGIAPTDTGFNYKSLIIYTEATKSMTYTEFQTWLSSNNIIVYYPLATPEEEEITEPTLINQLNAIKYGAESYYGQTNIMVTTNNLQPILKVQTLDKIGD